MGKGACIVATTSLIADTQKTRAADSADYISRPVILREKGEKMTITNVVRFKDSHTTCPVCGGHDKMSRDSQSRCGGFSSPDGKYVYCTNSRYAGSLERKNGTFTHYMSGACHCGVTHMQAPIMTRNNPMTQQKTLVAEYKYVSESDELLYTVARFEPKTFRQYRLNEKGEKIWNLEGVRRVLYRLPDVIKATTVFIVEGEKDADTLYKLGFCGTCNPMGAGKWIGDYNDFLRGKKIIIIPDNDEAGKAHAKTVVENILSLAEAVKVVNLPDGVKDVTEYFERNNTAQNFKDLISRSPTISMKNYQPKSFGELMKKSFDPIKWIVPNFLPEGLSILSANPKIGKSWLVLGLCLSVAAGGKAFGKIPVDKRDVLYLALEDNERRLQDRGEHLLIGEDPPENMYYQTNWKSLDDGCTNMLIEWIEAHPKAGLIVIDTLKKIKPRPKNNGGRIYDEDYDPLSELKALSDKYRIAILIVHHNRKASSADDVIEDISGSLGMPAAPDTILMLKRARSESAGTIFITGRDIPVEQNFCFDFKDGQWTMLDGDATDNLANPELSQDAQKIIRLLRDRNVPLSPKQISDILQINYDNTKKYLSRLMEKGEVLSPERGKYTVVKEKLSEVPF